MSEPTPVRPYLLRGFYEWVLDNDCTPYVVVDAADDRVQVPLDAVADGRIVLNIGPAATQGLEIGNDLLSFGARFSGVHRDIQVPVAAVIAIYAKENGRGITFSDEHDGMVPPSSPNDEQGSGRPQLKLVKS